MDNSKHVGSVFLNLSKVFDLVSQDILLSKIAAEYYRWIDRKSIMLYHRNIFQRQKLVNTGADH